MMAKRKKDLNDDEEIFNINDYEITDLSSLIDLINDLISKKPPPKKEKRKLPSKIYKLIDILLLLEYR